LKFGEQVSGKEGLFDPCGLLGIADLRQEGFDPLTLKGKLRKKLLMILGTNAKPLKMCFWRKIGGGRQVVS
jgi:hypothetical protein